MTTSTLDLTQRAPRSPRIRLGGYVILPRMLDKGRATIVGKHGEYDYACPLDQYFLEFAGIDAADLKEELTKGKGDGEILAWIQSNAKYKRTPSEIAVWSAFVEAYAPANVGMRGFFQETHSKIAPEREDISTLFELLDLDDFVTFGGKA